MAFFFSFFPDSANVDGRENVIVIHPDFRMIVLANRPGFPFLGNDFFGTLGKNKKEKNNKNDHSNCTTVFVTMLCITKGCRCCQHHKYLERISVILLWRRITFEIQRN